MSRLASVQMSADPHYAWTGSELHVQAVLVARDSLHGRLESTLPAVDVTEKRENTPLAGI